MWRATDGKVWAFGPFCAELCIWTVINRMTVPNSRFALQVIVKHGANALLCDD